MLIFSYFCLKFRNHLPLIYQMIRKLFSLSCKILVFNILFTTAGVAQISIEDAVKITLDRNLQIRQAQFGYELTEQDLYQSKSELYPNLSLGASNSYNFGLTFDQTSGQLIRGNDWTSSAGAQLSSSVTVFQGFQKVNQIRANKIQLSIDATEVEKIKNDLTLSVVTNYLEAITNNELFEAAKQQVVLSKEQLRQDSIQFEVGNKTIADIAQAENQVATDELNIMTSENAYDLSMLNLKQLMELPPDTSISLIKPDIAEVMSAYAILSFEEVYSQALGTQPVIEQAEYQKTLALKNIDLAKGGYYPSLSLSAGYGTNFSSQAMNPATLEMIKFFDQINENKSFRGTINLE